jgi:hypothetical protein
MARVVAVARPVRLAWRLLATVGVCTALGGCTIRTGDNVDASGGASSRDESPAATDTCDEVDSLPKADKRAAAEAGEAALTRDGKSLADAWADPAAFLLFQEAAFSSVGCDLMEHVHRRGAPRESKGRGRRRSSDPGSWRRARRASPRRGR